MCVYVSSTVRCLVARCEGSRSDVVRERSDSGEAVKLEVMVPLIATKAEFDLLKGMIDRVASEVEAEKGPKPEYITGTMIELPRAALRAGEIAETGPAIANS